MRNLTFIISLCLFFCSCQWSQNKPIQEKTINTNTERLSSPQQSEVEEERLVPEYFAHSNSGYSIDEEKDPEPDKVEPVKGESVSSSTTGKTQLSKEYMEGYDRGYDDGEDDALHRNGYGENYESYCKYKGKKRKDYIRGYEEGYEAGFYDNVNDDGDDDEYE